MVINDSRRKARVSFVFSTQSASFCCPRSRSNLGHFFDLSCLCNPLLLFPFSEQRETISPALLNSRMPCLTTVNNGHNSLLLCLAVDQRSSNANHSHRADCSIEVYTKIPSHSLDKKSCSASCIFTSYPDIHLSLGHLRNFYLCLKFTLKMFMFQYLSCQ